MAEESRIRVGVIGANPTTFASHSHLPAIKALPHYELVAVATTRMETAQASAQKFGAPYAFADPARLIEHPDVDLVAVVVKVPAHYELVHAALSAGKHVYCEWPLGLNVDEAEALAELARRSGLAHLVGLQGMNSPGAAYVAELVASGRIGSPVAVSSVTNGTPSGRQIPEHLVYAMDRASGANLLTVSTGHALSAVGRILGPFAKVSAVVESLTPEVTVLETGATTRMSSPDQVAIVGTLQCGAVASVTVQGGTAEVLARQGGSARPPGPGFEVRIVGTEATLAIRPSVPERIHMAEWQITMTRSDGSTEQLPVPDRLVPIPDSLKGGPARNVAAMYYHLADAILGGKPLSPDFDVAVKYHRLIEAVQRASDLGTAQILN